MEKSLVSNFIDAFIPPVEHNRKYRTTTMHSIYNSLQRIFLKYGNIDLKWDDVCSLFEDKGYRFTDAKMRYVDDIKAYYVSPNGNHDVVASVMERGNTQKMSPYFYVNISPTTLNDLTKTTKRLPAHTNDEKLKKWADDKRELEVFFKSGVK